MKDYCNLVEMLERIGLCVDLLPISLQKRPQYRVLSNSDIMQYVSKIGSVGNYAQSPQFSINFASVKTFDASNLSRPKEKIAETNKIQIEIKFFMKTSPKEISQYFGTNSKIEEFILNKFTEIIDVDTKRKQIYFKIKTGIEKNCNVSDDLYERFVIIGKFDSTNYGFIFDMSMYSKTPPKTIEQLYRDTTPAEYKNKCKISQSEGGTKYADKKDIGIRRIGYDGFFLSTTSNKVKRNRRSRRDITNERTLENDIHLPTNKNYGIYMKTTKYFSGHFDYGFNSFDTTRNGTFSKGFSFDCYTNSLTQDITHQ